MTLGVKDVDVSGNLESAGITPGLRAGSLSSDPSLYKVHTLTHIPFQGPGVSE